MSQAKSVKGPSPNPFYAQDNEKSQHIFSRTMWMNPKKSSRDEQEITKHDIFDRCYQFSPVFACYLFANE
jgi:hypothetical protein